MEEMELEFVAIEEVLVATVLSRLVMSPSVTNPWLFTQSSVARSSGFKTAS